MKQNRDTWLAIGLGLLLLLITITSVIQKTQKSAPVSYSSHSNGPEGARALYLWLEAMGYQASNAVTSRFSIHEQASTVILLEPSIAITDQEWETLDSWIEEGGTLILAGNGWGMRMITLRYDLQIAFPNTRTWQLSPQVPFFNSPPIQEAITCPDAAYFKGDRIDMVALFANEGRPAIVSFEVGQGRIILSATAYPFSNAGLKEAGNPALVLNLVSAAKKEGMIWLDEWHHGLRGAEVSPGGLKEWLLTTPPGNALIYVVAVIFIALILQGRSFGMPLPLPSKTSRPAPIEYITAIANLSRRAGHQAAALQLYQQWLKRALAERYRINPLLPDETYLEHLAKHIPPAAIQDLRSIFARMNQASQTETDFVRLAAKAASWPQRFHHGQMK